jgi:hypothetical protein
MEADPLTHHVVALHLRPFLFIPTYLVIAIVGVYGFFPAFFSTQNYLKRRGIEQAINEFEYVKQILLVEIPICFLFVFFFPIEYSSIESHGHLGPEIAAIEAAAGLGPITAAVIGGLLRIAFQIVRRRFRFYFAKGCFSIMIQKEEELKKIRYLKLGLDSYNRYLRRRLKYQISDNIINKFYFKYICASSQEKREMINSLIQAFEDESFSLLPKPVICISAIMKVPETEEFLTQETFGQKLKVVGTLLAATIPILISIIDILLRALKLLT